MFWPIFLPAKITFWLLIAAIGLITASAPVFKWKRNQAFGSALLAAVLLFVPSCQGVMVIVDPYRFGTFEHATFADVKDVRVERYLPSTATKITLRKYPSGHEARYTISEADLKAYVDQLWERYGEYSVISREELHPPKPDDPAEHQLAPDMPSEFEQKFTGTGWQPPENLLEIHGPRASNGAGVDYFYDSTTKTAYHRGSYW